MQNALFLIPTLPLLSSIFLGILGRKLPKKWISSIGMVSVAMTTLLTLAMAIPFLLSSSKTFTLSQNLWTWLDVGPFKAEIGFYLDTLSLIMITVISIVSFLIHIYSAEYMEEEEGLSRFYSYMNLFVASMLALVLANNLLFLYMGWEGVGLCSYLLIGFWYKVPAHGRAARKAFFMTRVGDTAMAIGIFILYLQFETLEIQPLLAGFAKTWQTGSSQATLVAFLLLAGAVGKSAQLPLQTWLPDAMAGPTPVSALIHAATMVTAGVYLIARMHLLYDLAPQVQFTIAVLGASTLILASFSALTQSDIKRILAYSTMSQVGYMFLALGVGAWSAAIFHLMTHAFFKALLFLSAGAVILSLQHQQNIFKMGGLRKKLPLVFWTFICGSACLSAFPLITSGFYSKDLIISQVFESPKGGWGLGLVALIGSFLTSFYTFRMVFHVFFGKPHTPLSHRPKNRIYIPLCILSVFSIVIGFLKVPAFLGTPISESSSRVSLIASLISLGGIALSATLYFSPHNFVMRSRGFSKLLNFWSSGWGFDRLFDFLLVQPFYRIAQINRNDGIDFLFDGIALFSISIHRRFSQIQNGSLRWYAAAIGAGAAVLILLVEVL